MTSKIKVDNINKVSDDSNIIKKCGTTITLGASGDNIALASGASQTGFGRTGTVDWNTTPKTTGTFTAVSGDGFFLNTSGGVITANLPAGTAGAIVSFADYAGTWQTSNVTVVPDGTDKIGGANGNATLNIEGQSVTFVFVDSTQGWINTMDSTSNARGEVFICGSVSGTGNTLTTVCTNFKVATFTGPGTFTVNSGVGPSAIASYLVIAGGGGGGGDYGGGGGAGGFREGTNPTIPYTASPIAKACGALPLSPGPYTIAVGAGGTAGGVGPSPSTRSGNGINSTFSTITSTGGGGGGHEDVTPVRPGAPGGSGGGATYPPGTAGTGNTPPVTPDQGKNGGVGGSPLTGGGGGGAVVVGTAGCGTTAGPGGNGTTSSITGASVARGGGGGGAGGGTPFGQGYTVGTGGTGGGAAGAPQTNNGQAPSAPDNTGGGGGGGNNIYGVGGVGGSGIVVIRYRFQ